MSMKKKYQEYEKRLRPCYCGGRVVLTGGTYGYPTFEIKCTKCGGGWSMDTYSPKEALEKWGENRPIGEVKDVSTTIPGLFEGLFKFR